jgi:PAS domain S-box-containing protein
MQNRLNLRKLQVSVSVIRKQRKLTLKPAGPSKLKNIWQDRSPNLAESITVNNALIASIGEGLVIFNEYGEISHINQPALDILGYSRDELEGKWLPEALLSFDKEGREISMADRPAMEALLTGSTVAESINYKRKDGSLVPVFSTSSPFMLNDKPLGGIIIFRDVSKEAQIERAKDEFVSLASHQLRTPLTSIRFFSELLKDPHYGKLSAKQLNYLDKILTSTERMIGLVTELLNISRLNLGQLEIKPVPTNINNLVRNQLTELAPNAKIANISLVFNTSIAKKDWTVPLDRTLLSQVVHNLISNAIRYSQSDKAKTVNISLKKTAKYYQISVSDSGIGIPKAAENKIYERFYRADNAVKFHSEGTGLGLYLVKVIIEAAGGGLKHKSIENKGTTFTISVPVSGMVPSGVDT